MTKGTVIFLSGASSSGKTTLAKELQRVLDEPYLHVAGDNFISMFPKSYFPGGEKFTNSAFDMLFMGLISGMHHCVTTIVSLGSNVILDHVLQERTWLNECVDLLADAQVLFVGVRCPLEELERREQERGDRRMGLARQQYDLVHSHGIYDLEVDTSISSPTECALQIKSALAENRSPHVFNRMRAH